MTDTLTSGPYLATWALSRNGEKLTLELTYQRPAQAIEAFKAVASAIQMGHLELDFVDSKHNLN